MKEALAGLGKIIPRRTVLPALGCLKFHAVDNKLLVTATDLTHTAAYSFESAGIEKAGKAFLVNYESLKPLAKGSDKDSITLEGNGDKATIINVVAGQTISETIETIDAGEYPNDPPPLETKPVDVKFIENIRKACTCASTDEARQVLTGVLLETGKEGQFIVGCDGKRLMALKVKMPVKDSCILPPSKFLAWFKPDKELFIGLQKGKEAAYFQLNSKNWIYRCKVLEGTYPNWKTVIPKSSGKNRIEISDADAGMLAQALPRLPGKDKNGAVTFSGINGKLVVQGAAGAQIELPNSQYAGTAHITLNRDCFLNALECGFLKFTFEDAVSPIYAEDEAGIYLLMPLRGQYDKTEEVQTQPATQAPQPENEAKVPVKKENKMPEETKTESALDKILVAFEAAKAKLHEAKSSLVEIADAVKLAVREQKSQKNELENARVLLGKLQAVKL